MSPPEAHEHRTPTATSIGGRVPLRFPRLPLLAWVALATFALAFVAAAISSPGRYVADARFEIYWGTGRYLRSQLSLWDGVRNLGRPNPYFSPVIGAFVGGLRLIGMSPKVRQRIRA